MAVSPHFVSTMASGDVVGQVRLLELLGRGFEKVNRRFVNADIIR